MIPLLILLAMVFAPGLSLNSVHNKLFAVALLLLAYNKPLRLRPLTALQWMLVAMLGWMALVTALSAYPAQSFNGFWMRHEGWLTWASLVLFAIAYCKITDPEFHRICLFITAGVMLAMAVLLPPNQITSEVLFGSRVSMSAVAAMVGVAIWSFEPGLILLVMPTLILCDTRCGIIALTCGILAYHAPTMRLKGCFRPQEWSVRKKAVSVILVIIAVSSVILTPLAGKFCKFNVPLTGARANYVLQADKLAKNLPLTGFGVDTLSHYLVAPEAKNGHVLDRTHNVLFDIVLQTGWLGYLLSLCILGVAVHRVLADPTVHRRLALGMVVAWIAFNLFNPSGISSHWLMLVALCMI